MADTATTGPRRAKKVDNDGQAMIVFEDTGESLVFDSAAQGSGLKTQVALAFQGFNMFERQLVTTDANIVAVGKLKTWIFLLIFPSLALSIIIWYIATPQLQAFSVANPSYSDYMSFIDKSPTCNCRKQNMMYRDVAGLNVPPLANMSRNFCKPVNGMWSRCFPANTNNAANSTCISSDAAAMLTFGFLESFVGMCETFQSAVADVTNNILTTQMGNTLLTPDAYTDLINKTVRSEAQKFAILVTSVLMAFQAPGWAGLAPRFDYSVGATYRNPPGCNCSYVMSPGDGLPEIISYARGICSFRIAFDDRPIPDELLPWVCMSASNILYFPVNFFRNDSAYITLGLTPPFVDLQNYETSTTATIYTVGRTMVDMQVAFAGDAGPPPGVAVGDFLKYYSVCNPAECRYNITAIPSFITGITMAFGVISGVQSMLVLILDRGIDFLYKSKLKNRLKLPGVAEGDGSKFEGGKSAPTRSVKNPMAETS